MLSSTNVTSQVRFIVWTFSSSFLTKPFYKWKTHTHTHLDALCAKRTFHLSSNFSHVHISVYCIHLIHSLNAYTCIPWAHFIICTVWTVVGMLLSSLPNNGNSKNTFCEKPGTKQKQKKKKTTLLTDAMLKKMVMVQLPLFIHVRRTVLPKSVAWIRSKSMNVDGVAVWWNCCLLCYVKRKC